VGVRVCCGCGVCVCVCVAPTNPPTNRHHQQGEASKFEGRIEGLLAAFRRLKLPPSVVGRFHLMGGECNYLLRVHPESYRLEFVPDEVRAGVVGVVVVGWGVDEGIGLGWGLGWGCERVTGVAPRPMTLKRNQPHRTNPPQSNQQEWHTGEMAAWEEGDIESTLNEAQRLLTEGAARLMLPVSVIRKTRSVGVVPTGQTIYEVLEDLSITVATNLISPLPFCAFNGGNDVFVDIGNKSIGLDALMNFLDLKMGEVRGVGGVGVEGGGFGWLGLVPWRLVARSSVAHPFPPPPPPLSNDSPTTHQCTTTPHHTTHRWCTWVTGSRTAATTQPRARCPASCGWPTRRRPASSSACC